MKVSYNWLKDYLDLSQTTPSDLAQKITLTGLEVDGMEGDGQPNEQLVVGHVKDLKPLVESDHLKIAQVDVGQETLQIVCGAPNIKEGQKVIVAKAGAVLPGNFQIKKAKMMGQESNGMICALDEIGFSDAVIPKFAEKGIYILPGDAPVGSLVSDYLGLDDIVIELDITPNRADAMSMRGVAFEAGTVLNQRPKFPKVEEAFTSSKDHKVEDYIEVALESEADTPLYTMKIIEGVKVQESPVWLQKKLMSAGMRPIDNVVDITNYIMLEYGQPLHAFDYDKLDSHLIKVRRAYEGERLKTLDGQTRQLTPDNLVITNGEKAVGLAGVMGGFNSQVTGETQTIALESAVFSSPLIRRTANSTNLRSEASSRYERGLNLATVEEALNKAAQLIAELGEGSVVQGTAKAGTLKVEDKEVQLSLDKLNRLLGLTFDHQEVLKLFDRLGFKADFTNGNFIVQVPPRRWDISIDVDLVEEVARVYGYNKIPSTLPVTTSKPGRLTSGQSLIRRTRAYFESNGLAQAITYVLTTPEKAQRFMAQNLDKVTLKYPMSNEHQTMRQTVLASLLDAVAYNKARQVKDIGLYEHGSTFYKDKTGKIHEVDHLGGALSGNHQVVNWKKEESKVDFYTVKGLVENYLGMVGLQDDLRFEKTTNIKELHPGRTAKIILGECELGIIGQVHPNLAESLDLDDTYVFEINLEVLNKAPKKEVLNQAVSKYPGTSRDVALLVDEEVSHQAIVETIKENGGEYLESVHIFDLYQGEKIEPGKKSVAYSLFYRNPNHTLKDKEVDPSFDKVKELLVEKFNADIR